MREHDDVRNVYWDKVRVKTQAHTPHLNPIAPYYPCR